MAHAKKSKLPEVAGLAEIAQLARVSPQLVSNWAKRSEDMPKPLARLKCGPIWDKAEITKWLVSLGYTHLRD